MRVLFLSIFLTSVIVAVQKQADLVIFSYDRPLQLYALLESIELNMTGIAHCEVIYRVSNERFEAGYQELKQRFNTVCFSKQGNNPHADFKVLTERAAFGWPSEYVIFAVDDIIIKDKVDLEYCVEMMERTNAYGFYLRLGKNLTECYMLHRAQPLPPLQQEGNEVFSWTIKEGLYDWGYPNSVDMTLYKKSDIARTLQPINYRSPNTLEGIWATMGGLVQNRKALCFAETKMINVPMNLVQDECLGNRHMGGAGALSAQEMLNIFNKGLKIDIAPIQKMVNKGAHTEYLYTFIKR